MKKLHHEGVAGEMGEIAMDLFYQLQEPDTDKDGVSEEEKYRGAVNSFRSIFGIAAHRIAGRHAYPHRRAHGDPARGLRRGRWVSRG